MDVDGRCDLVEKTLETGSGRLIDGGCLNWEIAGNSQLCLTYIRYRKEKKCYSRYYVVVDERDPPGESNWTELTDKVGQEMKIDRSKHVAKELSRIQSFLLR